MLHDYIPDYINCTKEMRKTIAQKMAMFAQVADDFPVYIIHELSSKKNTVMYMSPKGLEQLGITLEELRGLEDKYYELFFNPVDAKDYLSKWNEFSSDYNNKGDWFTYFQQVKLSHSELPIWYLSTSTVIAYDEQQPLFSITLALRMNQRMPIVSKLDKILMENIFIKDNFNLFSLLTKREKEILTSMAQGLTPKEISEKHFTSELTVRTHRRNIKKKLHLKNDVELVHFASAFDLI